MKWKWIVLLYVLQSVCSLELGASSFHEISNKNLNKGRHKTSRIASVPTESTVDPGILHEAVDSYFPDVVYPTTVFEAAQQFYYSPQGYDDVLGPFPNDVKSSYKSFASGKGKTSNEKSSPIFVKRKNTIKLNETSVSDDDSSNHVNENVIDHNNLTPYENDLRQWEQNTTQLIANEIATETTQQYINQNIHQRISDDSKGMNGDILIKTTNDLQAEDEITLPVVMLSENAFIPSKGKLLVNDTFDAYTDERNQEHATNQDVLTNITNDQEDIEKLCIEDNNKTCHINITPNYLVTSDTSYILDSKESVIPINSNASAHVDLISNYTENSDANNQEYIETDMRDNDKIYNLNITSNDAVTSDMKYENDAEMSETKYGNNTYFVNVNPNYVVTSTTGNTREDFVNDIMNIYSLIEETLRAVSVVEFVVSKTLGTLGLKDNQNETTEYDQNKLVNNSMVTLVETF